MQTGTWLPATTDSASGSAAAIRLPRGWSGIQLLGAGVLLALLAAAALPADSAISAHLRSHPLPGDVARLVRLGETFAWGGSVALIILVAARLDPRGWRVAMPLATSAFGAGLVAEGCKLLVARLRPAPAHAHGATETFLAWLPLTKLGDLGHPYGHAVQSFPSGHAATAVGLAISLAELYPRGRWLFAGFAALACFQRMAAQAHFLSDVLAGAALGCLVGAACQWRQRSIGERRADA